MGKSCLLDWLIEREISTKEREILKEEKKKRDKKCGNYLKIRKGL